MSGDGVKRQPKELETEGRKRQLANHPTMQHIGRRFAEGGKLHKITTPHNVKYNHNNTSVGGAHLLELLLSFLRGDLEDDEGEYQAVNPALAFDYSPLDDERRS